MVDREPAESIPKFDANSIFDTLVSQKAISDERSHLSEFLSDDIQGGLRGRGQEIVGIRENARAHDDTETYDTFLDELKEIDYIINHYTHRARQRTIEMDIHGDQLWLDAADHGKMIKIQSLIDNSPQISHSMFKGGVLATEYPHDVSLHVVGDTDHQIQLPLNNIIDAEGFVSWEEGRKGEKMYDPTKLINSSELVIESFANKSTEAPIIPLVYGFIQQNGTVLYRVADGTHRVAAAKLKAKTHIQVRELQLQKIDGNIIDLDNTDQS